MSEQPKIVTERHLLELDKSSQPLIHVCAGTIRTFAAALEGKWHDVTCEKSTSIDAGDPHRYWCRCNARLLEQYHVK